MATLNTKNNYQNIAFWRFRQNNRQLSFADSIVLFNQNQNIKIVKSFDEWNKQRNS